MKLCELLFISSLVVFVTCEIPSNEYNALIDFYHSTNGDFWTKKTHWLDNSTDACEWYGVGCNAEKSHVMEFQLAGNHLTGSLPDSIGNFSAMEILSLDIPPNNIGGTMPASIGENMPLLQVFTLASQSLIGTIPESIGKCTKMTIFHMGGNHFTNIPSSIGNLGPMQSFAIEDNNMHNVTLPNKGPTFEKGVLGACDLSGNVFACPIPEWARDDFCQASCH